MYNNRKITVASFLLLMFLLTATNIYAQEGAVIIAVTQNAQYGVTEGSVPTSLPKQAPNKENITIFANKTNTVIVSLQAVALDSTSNSVQLLDNSPPLNADSIIQSDMLNNMKAGYNLKAVTADGRTIVWNGLGLSSKDIIYLNADGTFYNVPPFNAKANW